MRFAGAAAGRWVKVWPQPLTTDNSIPNGSDRSAGNGNALLATVKSQGMLVTDPAPGKAATLIFANERKHALVEHDLNGRLNYWHPA